MSLVPIKELRARRRQSAVTGGLMLERTYSLPAGNAEALAEATWVRGALMEGESDPGGARIQNVSLHQESDTTQEIAVVRSFKPDMYT